MCGPARPTGRARPPPPPAPPLASALHGPQDGGEGARRPAAAAGLCAVGAAGLPQGGPRGAPGTRGLPGLPGAAAPRHSRPPRSLYLTLNRRTSRAARVPGVPSGNCGALAGARTPGEGGPSARHALRACRSSAEDARRSRQSEPSARTIHQSSARFSHQSPPPEAPWPMGGRAFFLSSPDARASWVVRGARAPAGRRAGALSAGWLWGSPWARSSVWPDAFAAAGRAGPGFVLPWSSAWKPRRRGRGASGGRRIRAARGSPGRTRCGSCVPLHVAAAPRPRGVGGPACGSSGWRSDFHSRFPGQNRALGPVRIEKELG